MDSDKVRFLPQRELMEDLMDSKIDNMKISYDKMVGLLQEQLRIATEGREVDVTEDSVELDSSVVDDSMEQSVEESISASQGRKPLTPIRQNPSLVESTTDSEEAVRYKEPVRRSSRSNETSLVAQDDVENMKKSQTNGKRCVMYHIDSLHGQALTFRGIDSSGKQPTKARMM